MIKACSCSFARIMPPLDLKDHTMYHGYSYTIDFPPIYINKGRFNTSIKSFKGIIC